MILLDTNALIWIAAGHPRARPLLKQHQRLYVSPASVLELQLLIEIGRVRGRGEVAQHVLADERWMVDEPPAATWFQRAADIGWTRDPFDRLLAAHALLRRWRLATADTVILEKIGPASALEL